MNGFLKWRTYHLNVLYIALSYPDKLTMVLVYLTTKLGDFGQGQMLVYKYSSTMVCIWDMFYSFTKLNWEMRN